MKINRVDLLHTLELVSPGLAEREVVEQSNSFCFRGKKVFTFNDEIACIADTALDIEGAIPSDAIKSILNKLPEEHLDVSIKDNTLVLSGVGQSIGLTYAKKIELPIEDLEIPKKWKKLPSQFVEGLKLVADCAGKDEAQFDLTCIHIASDWIEAFDTYQFARFNIKLGMEENILVRQASLKHIIDLDMNKFAETEHWVHFKNDAGLVIACRRNVQKYNDLSDIASVTGKKIQLPKKLAELADRAEVFSAVNDEENHIRVDIKPNLVVVKGTGQYGWYRGSRKIKYGGEEISFMVHPRMLAQIVTQHTECEVCKSPMPALKASLGNFMFVTSLSIPVDKAKPAQKKVKKSNKK